MSVVSIDRVSVTVKLISVLSPAIGGVPLLCLVVFLWCGSFELLSLGFGDPVALLWDAGISCAFFVQHSGMVRRSFRMRVERRIPRDLYPAVYSIASGIALLLALGLWQRSSVVIWSFGTPWNWFLRIAFVLAIAGFVWGIRALRGFDGFGLRPIRDLVRNRTRPVGELTIRGPYRWVRHPLYSFVLVMVWACPEATPDRLLFNGLWSLWVVVGAVFEERDLLRDFGDEYERYRASVPMLLPRSMRAAWSESGPR